MHPGAGLAVNRLARRRARRAARQAPAVSAYYGRGFGEFSGGKYPGGGISDNIYSHTDYLDIASLRTASSREYTRGAVGKSIIDAFETAVIGTAGLVPEIMPDADYLAAALGFAPAPDTGAAIERTFKRWAVSAAMDYQQVAGFASMQAVAYRDLLLNGKCLAILRRTAAGLTWQLVNVADRLANWYTAAGAADGVAYISYDGMRIAKDTGRVLGYYITPTSTPLQYGADTAPIYIPKYDAANRCQVVDCTRQHAAGDISGLPLLTPVLQELRNLEKYRNFELHSAMINATIAMQVYSSETRGVVPNFGGRRTDAPAADDTKRDTEMEQLRPGWVVAHPVPGMELRAFDTKRPEAQFAPFAMEILHHIAGAVGAPYEILRKQFIASYSASRGAMLEWGKKVAADRQHFAAGFLAPILREVIFTEAAAGRLTLPGYVSGGAMVQQAYTAGAWRGDAPGEIDALKTAKALSLAVSMGFITREQAARQTYGTDYHANLMRLAEEQQAAKAAGVMLATPGGGADDDSDMETAGTKRPAPGGDDE